MNAEELTAAANRIAKAAEERRQWALKCRPEWSELHRGVSQQLQDRADQVASWAASAAHYESKGEAYGNRVDVAVNEFLAMAECTLEAAQ